MSFKLELTAYNSLKERIQQELLYNHVEILDQGYLLKLFCILVQTCFFNFFDICEFSLVLSS